MKGMNVSTGSNVNVPLKTAAGGLTSCVFFFFFSLTKVL